MLFSFAGLSHSKYVSYLLETIVSLELESSEELRSAVLQSTLINLTGRPGSFLALDLMQEYFNRLLQAIVQRKGADYGDKYIRDVVARNLHHFVHIKNEFREGVGLSDRSGCHSAPHTRPEVKSLLNVYQRHQLHYRRPGRKIEDITSAQLDDFTSGVSRLSLTKLRNWIKDTLAGRVFDSNELEPSEDSDSDFTDLTTFGDITLCDGELIFGDLETNIAESIQVLDDMMPSDGTHTTDEGGPDTADQSETEHWQ